MTNYFKHEIYYINNDIFMLVFGGIPKEQFKETQENDKLKDNFCKENNFTPLKFKTPVFIICIQLYNNCPNIKAKIINLVLSNIIQKMMFHMLKLVKFLSVLERSLKRWIDRYLLEDSIKRHNRLPVSYKIKKKTCKIRH